MAGRDFGAIGPIGRCRNCLRSLIFHNTRNRSPTGRRRLLEVQLCAHNPSSRPREGEENHASRVRYTIV